MRTAKQGRFSYFDCAGPEWVLEPGGWKRRPTLIAVNAGPGFSHKTTTPWLSGLDNVVRVVSVDLPGCGMASLDAHQDYSFDAYCADMEEIRRALDVERIILLGHGWGASLACEYAIANPERVSALVLVSPIRVFNAAGQNAEAQSRQVSKTDPTLIARYSETVWPLFDAALNGRGPWDPVEAQPWWGEMILTQFASPPPRRWHASLAGTPWRLRAYGAYKGIAMSQPDSAMAAYDLADRLRYVASRPLLIVSSDHDANYVASASHHASPLAAAAPSARLVLWNDLGHFPFVEAPDRFCEEVAAFIANVPS